MSMHFQLLDVLLAIALLYVSILPSVARNSEIQRRNGPIPVQGNIDTGTTSTTGSTGSNMFLSIHQRHMQKYESILSFLPPTTTTTTNTTGSTGSTGITVDTAVNSAATPVERNAPTSSSMNDEDDNNSHGSIERVCSPDSNGVAFPDDDFNVVLFHDDAEPMCNCYEEDNTDLVLFSLLGDNSTSVAQYLTKLNKAFAKIVGLIEYDCLNTCEHCFSTTTGSNNTAASDDSEKYRSSYCGILQTNESSTYRGVEGNFTMEEYSTGKIAAASWDRLFSESSFSITTCISFTQNEVGNLCYGSNFFNLSTTPTCYVQYNETRCNSCTFLNNITADSNATNNDCFVADCSNVIPDATTIDTCRGTGYDGIFRFIELIANGVANTSTVTLGSCDGPPTLSPIMTPTVSVQQASPTSKLTTATTTPTTTGSSTWTTYTPTSLWASFWVVVGAAVLF